LRLCDVLIGVLCTTPYTLLSDNNAEWGSTDCATGWVHIDDYQMVGGSDLHSYPPGSEYQNYDIRRSECKEMGLAVGF